MSKIFDLINELCPNGVEFRELGEIADIVRGQRVTKAELQNDGKYPVVSGGIKPLGFLNKFNREANTITVAQYGTAGYINFIEEKFWANDVCYCIFPKKEISNKFLLYCLMKNQEFIYSLRTNAIPAHLPQKLLSEIKLPVPPMEVQREIVRILDSFTLLTAELTARKKQYEFYRDFLLNFNELDKNGGGCELKMLGEMILNVSNIKWSNNDKIYNYIDLTSVDMQNHQIGNLSNISKEKHPSRAQQIVKFNDIIFATTRPMQKRIAMIPKYLDGQICSTGYCVLRVDEKIALSSWVYYVLCTSIFYDYVDKFQQGASYPSISDNNVKKFKIPVPSLQTQQKVVDILDKFDTLVNSITEGLPREIELRRKQYEHYRELLLNFKPKMTA